MTEFPADPGALPADVPMSGGLRLDPVVCSTFPAGPLPDPAPIADLPEGRRAWARGQRVRGQAWALQQIAPRGGRGRGP